MEAGRVASPGEEILDVSLVEPQDCRSFHVAVRGGDAGSLAGVLSEAGVGLLLPSGEVMVETAAVRTGVGQTTS
jgi:hypothetical protein